MGKAIANAVIIMVSAAAIPTIQAGIGAQLHHAERGGSAGIGVAVPAGANKGIYFMNEGLCLQAQGGGKQQSKQ